MSDEPNVTEQLEALQAQLHDAETAKETSNRERYAANREPDEARKERDKVAEENGWLRDQLHENALRLARVEGCQERVREFDPVSDKTAYADETNPIMTRNRPDNDHYGASPGRLGTLAMADVAAFGGERRRPWYRRG